MLLIGLSGRAWSQPTWLVVPTVGQDMHLFADSSITKIHSSDGKARVPALLLTKQGSTHTAPQVVTFSVKGQMKNRPAAWRCWTGSVEVPLTWTSDSTALIAVQFEHKKKFYAFYYQGVRQCLWTTQFHDVKPTQLIIVPLVRLTTSERSLARRIQTIFSPAALDVQLTVLPIYHSKLFHSSTNFTRPDSLPMYSGQMRLLRDQFFADHPELSRTAFFVFILPGFTDRRTEGYAIRSKALGFVPDQQNESALALEVARTFARGFGMFDPYFFSETNSEMANRMDSPHGVTLTAEQVDALRRPQFSFSMVDAFEDVPTNNGTIAYYVWDEHQGEIELPNGDLLGAIQRPFRKNFLTSRFQVKYALLRPIHRWNGYYISILNIASSALMLVGWMWLRRTLRRRWKRHNLRAGWLRSGLVVSVFLIVCWATYRILPIGNQLLDQFTVISGVVPELNDKNWQQARQVLFENKDFRKRRGDHLAAEVLIRSGNQWEIKKRKPVLYFDVTINEENEPISMRFSDNSDSLKVQAWDFEQQSTSHYLVFRFRDRNRRLVSERVYTFDGLELDPPAAKIDVPKRILVFVNGYRPTSVGTTWEENFRDIFAKGLEHRNSSNHIYTFDRYDYWQPWNSINLRFQNRINPNETYYADGHFSVSTSDFRNILNFTRVAQSYPRRCPNPKRHTCYYMENTDVRRWVTQKRKTENMLKMRPNRSGFSYRKQHGRIAGLNLLQILNALPGYSKNDTVFIVSHSMGFAYAMGMVDVLRGNIQLGAWYILAPENAKSGKVNPDEWQQVWQYGSRFHLSRSDAPCLQDGVAPQSGVRGLPLAHRLFIPEHWYTRKGFFDSHFVGYYTWVLDIPVHRKGAVAQR